jgi:hypothetical protein
LARTTLAPPRTVPPPAAPSFQSLPSATTPPISIPISPVFEAPQTDPRVEQLIKELMAQSDTASLQALINRLATPVSIAPPRQPDVGDVSTHSEAQQFRRARLRELDQQRQQAAESLAAQGLTGSGEFEGEIAKLREGAGEDIAGYEGALSGRLRQELMANEIARFNAELGVANLSRSGLGAAAGLEAGRIMSDRASRANLINTMLASQQAREQASRDTRQQAFANEMARYQAGVGEAASTTQAEQSRVALANQLAQQAYENALTQHGIQTAAGQSSYNAAVAQQEAQRRDEQDALNRYLALYPLAAAAGRVPFEQDVVNRARSREDIEMDLLREELARSRLGTAEMRRAQPTGSVVGGMPGLTRRWPTAAEALAALRA